MIVNFYNFHFSALWFRKEKFTLSFGPSTCRGVEVIIFPLRKKCKPLRTPYIYIKQINHEFWAVSCRILDKHSLRCGGQAFINIPTPPPLHDAGPSMSCCPPPVWLHELDFCLEVAPQSVRLFLAPYFWCKINQAVVGPLPPFAPIWPHEIGPWPGLAGPGCGQRHKGEVINPFCRALGATDFMLKSQRWIRPRHGYFFLIKIRHYIFVVVIIFSRMQTNPPLLEFSPPPMTNTTQASCLAAICQPRFKIVRGSASGGRTRRGKGRIRRKPAPAAGVAVPTVLGAIGAPMYLRTI